MPSKKRTKRIQRRSDSRVIAASTAGKDALRSEPLTLRERAEGALRATRADVTSMPPEEVQRLVHELQVHQIELEMQNEELRYAQGELARSRDRFNDLYDFAPVGYLTVDQEGTVLEANLTVAAMLSIDRDRLIGRKFAGFVARAAQDTLYLHQAAARRSGVKQWGEAGL